MIRDLALIAAAAAAGGLFLYAFFGAVKGHPTRDSLYYFWVTTPLLRWCGLALPVSLVGLILLRYRRSLTLVGATVVLSFVLVGAGFVTSIGRLFPGPFERRALTALDLPQGANNDRIAAAHSDGVRLEVRSWQMNDTDSTCANLKSKLVQWADSNSVRAPIDTTGLGLAPGKACSWLAAYHGWDVTVDVNVHTAHPVVTPPIPAGQGNVTVTIYPPGTE